MRTMAKEYTTLAQWGNSKATRIPSSILKLLNIDVNQKFSVSVKEESIVLTPEVIQTPATIHELFSGWEDDGIRHHEMDWGQAEGNELQW
ncbi:AbrB/MazE/SpoVT family DNA-binding domain-containing protein [Streptococcus pluranimalium]|uniref:AbrB/MazE/SpoVT family DNA-binding domain-containing protein n=1 Tax=Streptococcus TaxID=1301 RepID=UPI00201648A2|nr:AbrB/MazE/SpoVT family DNA-binding domain-containing protein [Streptococcus hyovaginalis]MDW8743539.1 AbrB/MazE/SpoVT family DNA-binding domain-containing protein [Streptococcus suis]